MDCWFKNHVEINCKYNTQVGYKNIIDNHIKPSLGIYKLKSLTPAILQEFINAKFINGFSKSHLTNMMTVLSGSLKYAVHPGDFIKQTPMQYVRYPKYEHLKTEINHKIITQDEFETILDRFPFGTIYHIPILIGYDTGCRIGEVMGLTWDDIDLRQGLININKIIYNRKGNWYFKSTKTVSSNREIKIGETLINVLKMHKKHAMENKMKYGQHFIQQYEVTEFEDNNKLRRVHSPYFHRYRCHAISKYSMHKENGEMATPDTFKYASRVINYGLGITFNFHSLRRTHATTLIENNANMKDVQLRPGHTRLGTTLDTYTHATDKMANDSVNIFEEATQENKSSPTEAN